MEGRKAMFLLRVDPDRQGAVLGAALGLGSVLHGASAGARELMLLARAMDPEALGRAARALAEIDGVEAVSCATMADRWLGPRAAGALAPGDGPRGTPAETI